MSGDRVFYLLYPGVEVLHMTPAGFASITSKSCKMHRPVVRSICVLSYYADIAHLTARRVLTFSNVKRKAKNDAKRINKPCFYIIKGMRYEFPDISHFHKSVEMTQIATDGC